MKNICFQMTRKAWLVAFMVLCAAFPALAQTITVKGSVVDKEGEPLIGASVVVKGETLGTATDFDGLFTISAPSNGTLVVSYVGYDTQEIPVDGRTEINVTLSENSVLLGEVVAIGYGTVKKSDATGSVATIKPSEIEAGLATSAQDLLVGASPGVVVTTSGNPSEGGNIQIRGGASLAASNAPLIVIDGVPMDTKGIIGSSNPLALVSPENVESMTILKDASATAIYGSRASNGVIIITTKSGAKGKPQVNFTMNGYINTTRKYLDMMSASQFRSFITDYYGEDSAQTTQLLDYDTDWQKALTRTTFSSDYSLSVGGTAKWLPYRVAVSYTDNNGIVKNTDMDRASASINLTPKFFDDLLSVNANVKGAYITNTYGANTLRAASAMNPTLPIKDPNGSPLFGYWTSFVNGGVLADANSAGATINSTDAPLNPIAENQGAVSKGKAYQSVGNLQLDLKMPFLTDLRANLNLGYDYQHGENYNNAFVNTPAAWNGGYQVLDNGTLRTIKDGGVSRTREYQTRLNLLLDFYLNYNHYFKDINSTLDVTAGYSWQKFHNKYRKFTRVYEVVDPENEQFLGNQANPTDRTIHPHQLVSFFGRVNFTFLDKYLITATVRQDGTSRFSKDHRWGTFPSVALGWKILEENFMESARSYMNELKLRAGYGVTGQQDLGDDYFPYLPVYNQWTGGGAVYPSITGNPTTGTYPLYPSPYNPDIKWEETHTWNVGVDFGFLNNRILGSLDYYKRKTKDLLTKSPYAAGSNLSNAGNMNLGDLENTGIEFNITARPVVTKDFRWTSSFNVAWNKNKITRLADGADTVVENSGISLGKGNKIQKHQVGKPAFSFYVYEQVYDSNGKPIEGVYVDQNGDGEINAADKILFHSKDPKVTMNWSNTFNYKNWDFGITLRASLGNYVYNDAQATTSVIGANDALPLANLNTNSYLFKTSTNELACSSYFVQNASFLRCDNITFGYTWDNLLNNNLRLRLYGACQNPFVITKYKGLDPEIFSGIDNNVYPHPLTFSFGIVASF